MAKSIRARGYLSCQSARGVCTIGNDRELQANSSEFAGLNDMG